MREEFSDLSHADHRVRLAAVERARRNLVEDRARLLEVLEPALSDTYPGVRAEAALTLGDAAVTDDAILERLAELVRVETGGLAVRQAALLGLGRAGLAGLELTSARWDGARSAALEAARDEDADVRFQGLTALTRLMASGPEVLEVARALVDDEDPEVVSVAAELLATLGDTQALAALEARMGSVPKDAQRTLLFAAAKLGGKGLVKPLLEETRRLPYALRACEALGHLGDPEAVEPLARLMGRWRTHRFIKVAAAAALVRLGDARGSETLGRALGARRKDMRGFAMEQVGLLGLAAFKKELIAVLKDPRDYHSDTAAVALAHLGGEDCVEALEAASEDPRQEVRDEAHRALANLRANLGES